jgi:hypothetical protein
MNLASIPPAFDGNAEGTLRLTGSKWKANGTTGVCIRGSPARGDLSHKQLHLFCAGFAKGEL